MVDAFTRYSPVIEARFNWRGATVADVLERVCKEVGYPRTIRVDQGPEFISKDLDLWAYRRGVVLDFSRPGKPTDNAYIESLNGKFRAECLNAHWFTSIEEIDLSPEAHPNGWRVRSSFEPNWLGGATGRGAEPQDSSSVPSRCIPGALSFANVVGGRLPRALCGLTVLYNKA